MDDFDSTSPPSNHEQIMQAMRSLHQVGQSIDKHLRHLEWAAMAVVLLLLFK